MDDKTEPATGTGERNRDSKARVVLTITKGAQLEKAATPRVFTGECPG